MHDQTVTHGTKLQFADYAGMARSFGMQQVETEEQLKPAIERALKNRPALLDIFATPEAVSSDGKTGLAWPLALRAADAQRDRVSDIVILAALQRATTDDVRIHFISSGWSVLHRMMELPRLLAKIGIELLEVSKLGEPDVARHIDALAEEEAK